LGVNAHSNTHAHTNAYGNAGTNANAYWQGRKEAQGGFGAQGGWEAATLQRRTRNAQTSKPTSEPWILRWREQPGGGVEPDGAGQEVHLQFQRGRRGAYGDGLAETGGRALGDNFSRSCRKPGLNDSLISCD
jgi:hypothetical protein